MTETGATLRSLPVHLLRCPINGGPLRQQDDKLIADDGRSYHIDGDGLVLFAAEYLSPEARVQELHYDAVASAYLENLTYPHTREYMAFLDRVFLDLVGSKALGVAAEICCGRGEAFMLLGERVTEGVGVDISTAMLHQALKDNRGSNLHFVQGDATKLPLASESFDTAFMLGGIHHVNDRARLFSEVSRILKPGGTFYFREPVSDFFLWRWLRALIYRVSPALDHETESPLRYAETVSDLAKSGLRLSHWTTHGFIGFCLFMNSDVLIANRLFRYFPGIRGITRFSTRLDEAITSLPPFKHAGLQVVGAAVKADGGR